MLFPNFSDVSGSHSEGSVISECVPSGLGGAMVSAHGQCVCCLECAFCRMGSEAVVMGPSGAYDVVCTLKNLFHMERNIVMCGSVKFPGSRNWHRWRSG